MREKSASHSPAIGRAAIPRGSVTVFLALLIAVAGAFWSGIASADDGGWAIGPQGDRDRVYLPVVVGGSAIPTGVAYETIPVDLPPTDRPAELHADLNLGLRGYATTSAELRLVDYNGDTDPDAPYMPDIFADHRVPVFTSVHKVYDWDWDCGPMGCRSGLLGTHPVTLLGMYTTAGELVAAPSRSNDIYQGVYRTLVLYADTARITLKYTRTDNVVAGYTVHIEGVSVDPNLLSLYRLANSAGRSSLPALRNGQPLGRAGGSEILVAVRDTGTFLDPRSRKDWWN